MSRSAQSYHAGIAVEVSEAIARIEELETENAALRKALAKREKDLDETLDSLHELRAMNERAREDA